METLSEHDHPEINAEGRVPPGGRALVLGSGGSTGNAWLIGVVAGMFEAGIDVGAADLIVGTSAGATAAAQITGAVPADLLAAVLIPPTQIRPNSTGPRGPITGHLDALGKIINDSADALEMRRRLGAAAHKRETSGDDSDRSGWRTTVARRLPQTDWPSTRLLITAIDADTGAGVVFDRLSGVDLVDAVAASCSNGFGLPAYRIGEHRYLDGGYRRNENADLATGYQQVIVLSPFGGRSLHPPEWRMQLSAQVEELRAAGSQVEVITPETSAEHLFGTNAMNLALRPDAARVGLGQGRRFGPVLADLWEGGANR